MASLSTHGLMLKFSCLLLLLLLLLQFDVSQSAEFTVGDSGGWTYNMMSWPNNKNFSEGDVLIFKYDPQLHNVVAVNAGEYNSCNPSEGWTVFSSGNDRIKLGKGENYFLCSFPGHCEQGMKIAVNAA